MKRRWNLNIHYNRLILEAAPPRGRALDIGCGEGLLAHDLAAQGLDVVGIDPHAPSIDRAASPPADAGGPEFICTDMFEHSFGPASFDLVCASAMLHHVDAVRALRCMKELVRPGGVIAVVGFAQASTLRDRALAVVGAALKRLHVLRGDYWEHESPVCWPPPLTTREMRSLAATELPGSTFRPLMSGRFALVWRAAPR